MIGSALLLATCSYPTPKSPCDFLISSIIQLFNPSNNLKNKDTTNKRQKKVSAKTTPYIKEFHTSSNGKNKKLDTTRNHLAWVLEGFMHNKTKFKRYQINNRPIYIYIFPILWSISYLCTTVMKKVSLEVIGTIAPYVSQENVIKPDHKLIYHEQNQKFQCIWRQKYYPIKIKEGKILKKSHLKKN